MQCFTTKKHPVLKPSSLTEKQNTSLNPVLLVQPGRKHRAETLVVHQASSRRNRKDKVQWEIQGFLQNKGNITHLRPWSDQWRNYSHSELAFTYAQRINPVMSEMWYQQLRVVTALRDAPKIVLTNTLVPLIPTLHHVNSNFKANQEIFSHFVELWFLILLFFNLLQSSFLMKWFVEMSHTGTVWIQR